MSGLRAQCHGRRAPWLAAGGPVLGDRGAQVGCVFVFQGHAGGAVCVSVRVDPVCVHAASTGGAAFVGFLVCIWTAFEYLVYCCAVNQDARYHSRESKVSLIPFLFPLVDSCHAGTSDTNKTAQIKSYGRSLPSTQKRSSR